MFIVHARVSASEPICMSSVSTYNMQVVRLHVRGAAIRLPPAMMGVGGRRGWAGTFRFMVWANTAWPALCGAGWVNKSCTGWQLYWGRIEVWLTTLIARKLSRAAHRAGGGP